MRLIDADALYQSFGASGNCSNCPHDWSECQYYNEHTLMEFCERIDVAPTVDAEPVRHGQWLHGREISRDYIGDVCVRIHYEKWWCSECDGRWATDDEEDIKTFRYCPNCGAKMDGGGEKNETAD